MNVRKSLSWLSVYIKLADFQYIPMITRGKIGCHWLSEMNMTTNDNEKTNLLSVEITDS